MPLNWDCSVLPFQSIEVTRKNLSRSGGLTLSGTEQVVQSSSDFWAVNATVHIHKREQILAYRALQAQSYGRATDWLITVPISAGVYAQTRFVTQSGTETSFTDEFSTEFTVGNVTTVVTTIPYPHITGKVSGTAVRGATTLSLTMDNAAWVPVPGTYFSIGSRLYLIATVVSGPPPSPSPLPGSTPTPSGIYTITFVPKLRTTANAGASIEFTLPKCLMRLASDNIGQLNLDGLKRGDVSLSFVEVPT